MKREFKAVWTGNMVTLDTTNLTEMEAAVMIASRINEFNDCMESCTWTFTVQDYSKGVAQNQFRGVCSSLIKKGYISIDVDDGDSYFGLTEEGKKLFSDYE